MSRRWMLAGLVAAVIGSSCSGGGSGSADRPSASPSVSPASASPSLVPASPSVTTSLPSPTPSAEPTGEGPPPIPLEPLKEIEFDQPSGIVYEAGSLWVPNAISKKIRRLDPTNGKTTAIIQGVPYESETPFSAQGLIWLASDSGVAAIDPANDDVVFSDSYPGVGVVWAGGSWWVDDAYNELVELHAGSFDVGDVIGIGPDFRQSEEHANYVSAAMDDVWVGSGDAHVLYRFDPGSLKVVAKVRGVGYRARVLEVGGRTLVYATDGTIRRLDPATNKIVETLVLGDPVYGGATAAVIAEGHVWINAGHLVYEVDPKPLRVRAVYDVLETTWGIAIVDGVLWIPFFEESAVRKYRP
jgi:streptogramin lyase